MTFNVVSVLMEMLYSTFLLETREVGRTKGVMLRCVRPLAIRLILDYATIPGYTVRLPSPRQTKRISQEKFQAALR